MHVTAGDAISGAVSAAGELFTWGRAYSVKLQPGNVLQVSMYPMCVYVHANTHTRKHTHTHTHTNTQARARTHTQALETERIPSGLGHADLLHKLVPTCVFSGYFQVVPPEYDVNACIHMWVCMDAMRLFMHTCVCACLDVCLDVCVGVCVCMCIYSLSHTHTHTCICTNAHTQTHTHKHARTHTHTHTHITSQGKRIGRCRALSPHLALAFASGTHPRL